MMAIVAGLSAQPVSRLRRTWQRVDKSKLEVRGERGKERERGGEREEKKREGKDKERDWKILYFSEVFYGLLAIYQF